jgi:steroid delta-isomerase-like uncharacterized protein
MATRTTTQAKDKAAPKEPAKPQRRRITKRKLVEQHARSYFDALARRDPADMAAHWAEDGVEEIVPLGVFRGPREVERLFSELFAAVPDAKSEVRRLVSGEREVAVEWRMTGSFTGAPFQGLEPTGRRLELRGLDLLEIEDGKILSNTAYYDGAAFARQIGMLPALDSGAERAMKGAVNAVTKARRAFADLRYRTAA